MSVSARDPGTPTPVIELSGFSKIYRSGEVEVRAVDDISLQIHPGEFVAIMGASGSGKSTLMNTLGCLDVPTQGTYRLNGQSVSGLAPAALARLRNQKIGFIFQSFNLLARTTALENVELPLLYARPPVAADERRRRALRALERVDLAHRAQHRPNQLSGGQQQRIAIARALVNAPELVLADEPTGNLDSRMGLQIMRLLQELNAQGITLVMVTHEVEFASFCKRIVTMKDGRIISDRAPSERRSALEELQQLESNSDAIAP